MTRKVKVAIVGAGTAGLNAMRQVSHVTKDFVLINGGHLGTTCARVGCMPSKVAIQVADDFERRGIFPREGIAGGDGLTVDVDRAFEHVRDIRDILVDRVLVHSTDNLGDRFIDGYARFIALGTLEVNGETIEAENIVLAPGTTPVVPKAWEMFGDRILTTDSFFELENWPSSMAVIGLGMIGLELGQAISRMGIEVTGFDILEIIGGIDDPEISRVALDLICKEFPMHLGAQADIAEEGGLLRVTSGEHSVLAERVLVSMGRRSNLYAMDLEKSGLPLHEDGLPDFNPNTMRVNDSRVFVAGDCINYRQVLHEGGNEGRIAGYNAVSEEVSAFARTVPFSVAFTDPNICAVGEPYSELDPDTIVVGEMKFGPLGRGLVMGKNKGLLRLYVRKVDGRLLGAGMCAPKGENLAHLLAWSIEQKLTVRDMIAMPFYHPTVEEALQGALRSAISKIPKLSEGRDYPLDIRPLEEPVPEYRESREALTR